MGRLRSGSKMVEEGVMMRPYINVKLPAVPEFVVEKDVDNYIRLFNRVASLSDWDEETKTAALVAELGMKWIEVVGGVEENATVAQVIGVLKAEVRQAGLEYVKRKEFEGKARNVGQTWRSYVNELRRLAAQGFGDYHEEIIQNKLFEKLMSELPKKVRDKMINKNLVTVATVLDQLDILGEREAQSDSYDRTKMKVPEVAMAVLPTSRGEASGWMEVVRGLHAEMAEWMKEMKALQSSRQGGTRRGQCFICQSGEHYAPQCPRRTEQPAGGRAPGVTEKGNCFICQAVDHLARDCPKRRNFRDRNERSCILCRSREHIADNCPRKSVQQERRRECYQCFSPDHIYRDCPFKGEGGGIIREGGAVLQVQAQQPSWEEVPQPQRPHPSRNQSGNVEGLAVGTELES